MKQILQVTVSVQIPDGMHGFEGETLVGVHGLQRIYLNGAAVNLGIGY